MSDKPNQADSVAKRSMNWPKLAQVSKHLVVAAEQRYEKKKQQRKKRRKS